MYSEVKKGELIYTIIFLLVCIVYSLLYRNFRKIITVKDNYRFTFGKGSPFKVQWARLFSFHFLLDEGTSVPREVDMDDYTIFGLHTILFDLGGVEVDFGASSFCFHSF